MNDGMKYCWPPVCTNKIGCQSVTTPINPQDQRPITGAWGNAPTGHSPKMEAKRPRSPLHLVDT